jgi:flagellum-specific peptidoglycan hydrolase FlgJ
MSVTKIVVTYADGTSEELDNVPPAPPVNNNHFFPAAIIEAAQVSHKKYWPRGPFVCVTLAQWALESGYGKHASGLNNYFGIQANKDQLAAGQYTMRWSREEDPNGVSSPKNEPFANYTSVTDCFDAHARLLTSPHYELCVKAQTPEQYCAALKERNYATAHNYVAALLSIIRTHNLKQYDQRF